MTKELREMIENLEGMKIEVRGLLGENKVDDADTKMAEVRALEKKIKIQQELEEDEKRNLEVDKMEKQEVKVETEERTTDQVVGAELRDIFEGRAAMNTGVAAEGGVVVNSELTKEIIKTLKDRSNVFGFFNNTTIAGKVRIPKKVGSGTATWGTEQKDPNNTASTTIPTLEVLELGQERLYTESAITQQMLNVQEIDLKSFIVDDISETMGDAIENVIFHGTGTNQPTGLLGAITKKVSLAIRGTITVDDLKKCKAKLKKQAQNKAKWFMHADTLLEIDLIKDANGQYMLKQDITSASGYTLLGLPVEITDVMPTLADVGAKCVVVLATPESYHINMQKSLSLNVYDDSVYKRAGLIGFGSDMYLDGKVKNDDVLAGVFNKSV